MRKITLPCLLLAGLSLGAPAASAGIIVIQGPLDPAGPVLVMKQASWFGEFGALGIAEGDSAAVKSLRRAGFDAHAVGPWLDGMHLYVALAEDVPPAVRPLFTSRTSPRQVVFAAPAQVPGAGCNHHVAEVKRQPWTAASFREGHLPGIQAAVTVDPRIAALVSQVNSANLLNTVTQLSSNFTRRADSAQITNAKNWIISQIQAIPGLTVTTQTFNASYAPNIIVTKTGLVHPNEFVVLGGHYDSINQSGSGLTAPGADDNASGSAGILEAARILAQGQFDRSIRLMFYSAEELGLVGSEADAAAQQAAGTDIVAMLCMDMIAHLEAGDTYDCDFASNSTDATLTQFCRDVGAAYNPGFATKVGVLTAGTSDHASYQAHGFPAAFFFEDLTEYSHFLHTANDTLPNSPNNFNLAADIVRDFIASAATIARPVDLQIAHTALTDSTNSGGPYPLSATITSLTPATVASAELHWRVNGGSWQTKSMVKSTAANTWLSSIPGVSPSGNVDYYLFATDSAGNTEWLPSSLNAGDEFFSFTVGAVTTIFSDDFEAAGENGWTSVQVATQNDWQKGTPQGKGGYDPNVAASGANARGNDLGIGNFNGIYQPNVDNYLESPAINCSGRTGVKLRFKRWLSVEDGTFDQARIQVNGTTVWTNPATPGGSAHTIDSSWTTQEVNVAAQADNNPSVKIRFRLTSDGGLEFGGWTVDDVQLRTLGAGTAGSLVASERYLSASAGGSVGLTLNAGAANAGRTYVIGLSVTGDAPGTPLGSVTVPLVFDAATTLCFSLLNTPSFANFAGVLPGSGIATATLNLPAIADPSLPGLTIWLAGFTAGPTNFASNSVAVTFGV